MQATPSSTSTRSAGLLSCVSIERRECTIDTRVLYIYLVVLPALEDRRPASPLAVPARLSLGGHRIRVPCPPPALGLDHLFCPPCLLQPLYLRVHWRPVHPAILFCSKSRKVNSSARQWSEVPA